VHGLHAGVVCEFPLALGSDVLVVEVRAAALGPADWLRLGESPEEHGIVGEELETKVEEGAVESEAEAPPNLHYYYYWVLLNNYNYKKSIFTNLLKTILTLQANLGKKWRTSPSQDTLGKLPKIKALTYLLASLPSVPN
jgi:hypothetical protein